MKNPHLSTGWHVATSFAAVAGIPYPLMHTPPTQVDDRAVPFHSAALEPETGTALWTIRWTTTEAARVSVHVGTTVRSVAHRPEAARFGTSGEVSFHCASARPWVRLSVQDGPSIHVTTRALGFASAPNFRDVGGYRTTDGRWVRQGIIYRAPALSLSDADLAAASTLGITGDFDLRTTEEARTIPDAALPGADYFHVNVLGTVDAGLPDAVSPSAASEFMVETQRWFVDAEPAKAAYRRLFARLATDEGASVYHCTAGKDRTGWATAMLLTLLGVPRETVLEDYLLSNAYYLSSPAVQLQLNEMTIHERAIQERFMAVDPTYLEAGLDRVAERYGTMEVYAEKGLGLHPDLIRQLRDKMLVTRRQP